MTYSWAVAGQPYPWVVQRARVPNKRATDAVLNMRAYQTAIQAAFIAKYGRPELLTGAIRLTVRVWRLAPRYPKDVTDDWLRQQALRPPDATNYQKAVEDALTGLVFVDDAQVVWPETIKSTAVAGTARTIIEVRELYPHD